MDLGSPQTKAAQDRPGQDKKDSPGSRPTWPWLTLHVSRRSTEFRGVARPGELREFYSL